MQQSTKRKIAKEIIIFFGSIALIGLIWSGFVARNNYFFRRINSTGKQIVKLDSVIDSIKRSLKWTPPIGDFVEEPRAKADSIAEAMDKAQTTKPRFDPNKPSTEGHGKIVTDPALLAELNDSLPSIDEANAALAKSRTDSIAEALSASKKKEKEQLHSEYNHSFANICDLNETALCISLIVFTAVYPFRFIVLLLLWAFKTLRQKQA